MPNHFLARKKLTGLNQPIRELSAGWKARAKKKAGLKPGRRGAPGPGKNGCLPSYSREAGESLGTGEGKTIRAVSREGLVVLIGSACVGGWLERRQADSNRSVAASFRDAISDT